MGLSATNKQQKKKPSFKCYFGYIAGAILTTIVLSSTLPLIFSNNFHANKRIVEMIDWDKSEASLGLSELTKQTQPLFRLFLFDAIDYDGYHQLDLSLTQSQQYLINITICFKLNELDYNYIVQFYSLALGCFRHLFYQSTLEKEVYCFTMNATYNLGLSIVLLL